MEERYGGTINYRALFYAENSENDLDQFKRNKT